LKIESHPSESSLSLSSFCNPPSNIEEDKSYTGIINNYTNLK